MNANFDVSHGLVRDTLNDSNAASAPGAVAVTAGAAEDSKDKKKKKVIEVKFGNAVVKIYQVPTHGCMSYQVADYSSGKRQLLSFADKRKATDKAEEIAKKLAKGEGAALQLTNEDRTVYVRAVEAIKRTGTPLDVVAMRYAQGFNILGGDQIIEACKDFARRHGINTPPKLMKEVYDELIADAKARKLSERYIEDLEYRCGSFAAAFQVKIGDVTGAKVREFLTGRRLGPRSHNNFVRSIKRLFEFAKERKYLPRDHDELDGVGFVKDVGGEIEVFTPAEMVRLLAAAPEHVRVCMALGGFAGLRSAEIERVDWSEISLKEGFIKVIAGKGKTASRRIVPIAENLAKWLKPCAREGGPLWPLGHAYFYEGMREAARRTRTKQEKAVDWKHNGLRHSFISYRVAGVQNVNQVALEAGNSPQMIFRHYRELVSSKQAAEWFGIGPESLRTAAGAEAATNIVALPGVAVG